MDFGFGNGVNAQGGLPVNAGLFAQTGDSATVTNTTVETTIVGGGVGTLIVPANGFAVGDSFSAQLGGVLSSVNNTDITLQVKSDTVLLATSGAITLPQCTNKNFFLTLVFTIRAIGAANTAQIQTSGLFTYSKDASNAFEGSDLFSLNNNTFDTTIQNRLNITVKWATANAGNSIYSTTFVLNKIY